MIKIDKKKTPLNVLRSIKNLRTTLYQVSQKNSGLVDTEELPDEIFYAKDRDENSQFYFKISTYEQRSDSSGTIEYKVEFSPANETTISKYQSNLPEAKTLDKYSHWLKLLSYYNSIHLTVEDEFEKIYEDEFIEYFDIIDTDSEKLPFRLEQQLFLNDFLDSSIQILHAQDISDEAIKDLIINAEALKEKLPVLSKKDTIRHLSKLFAKARKKSISLLKKLGNKFSDEIIKRGVNWSLDKGAEYFIDFFN